MSGSGDSSDPTWVYICKALIRGRTLARALNHKWKGDSCFVVSTMALGLVKQTRDGKVSTWFAGDGGPTMATDNRMCEELAWADHYLQMRAMSGFTGPIGSGVNRFIAFGYDSGKRLAMSMQSLRPTGFPQISANPLDPTGMLPNPAQMMIMARSLIGSIVAPIGDAIIHSQQESDAPMSKPSDTNDYWEQQGRADGIVDFQNSNLADEIATIQRYKSLRGKR